MSPNWQTVFINKWVCLATVLEYLLFDCVRRWSKPHFVSFPVVFVENFSQLEGLFVSKVVQIHLSFDILLHFVDIKRWSCNFEVELLVQNCGRNFFWWNWETGCAELTFSLFRTFKFLEQMKYAKIVSLFWRLYQRTIKWRLYFRIVVQSLLFA